MTTASLIATNQYTLDLKVDVHVTTSAKPVKSRDGKVRAFKLKDGTTVRPVLAFERGGKNEQYSDLSGSAELGDLGLYIEDYLHTEFNEAES
jgi:hypothetical protein